MATKKFTNEELNYFRICYVVTRVVPEELRKFFKQEWNTRYQATYGRWVDTAKNANDFYSMESPGNRKRNGRLLTFMANGNTSEWDCTCLFYALLYSDCIGRSLNSTAETNVDELRNIRNGVFAHAVHANLKEVDFQASMKSVLTAFSALKLDPAAIYEMKNQKSFLTDELSSLQQQLKTEKKRNAELYSFCILPPKPSHDTTDRRDEVLHIYKEMIKLRSAKINETTVIYLSGNPGCGKSELARQIGHKYFNEEADAGAELRLVFTLNGSSLDTILQSYLEFAGRLECDQDFITKITSSKDLNKDEKIIHIRGVIASRIQTYSYWLIIVDNIVDLKSVFHYLPQAGEKTVGKGQILVTTQDSQSIQTDSYTYHISLSPGMRKEEAVVLLCKVSGLESEDWEQTLKVAKALDFQPLALACAAVYMQRVRYSSTGKVITWEKYLEKLQNNKRESTEAAYKKTSLAYQSTMTAAVKLALEREVDNDEIMMYAFHFLSNIASEQVPLKYVVNYVIKYMPDEDEDLLSVNISSSSLVISSENVSKESQEVRCHQVVYHCLQNVLNEKSTNKIDIFDVVLAFSDIHSFDLAKIGDVIETRSLNPHFGSVAKKLERFVESDHRPIFIRNSSLFSKFIFVGKILSKIGEICLAHGSYRASNTCFHIVFMIQQETVNDDSDPALAITLHGLGNSYRELGQYEDAKMCLERALRIQSSIYPEKHPSVASTLSGLAITIRHLGHFEQARMCLERALDIQESLYGSNHPQVGVTLNNIGGTFRDLGQYTESKLYLERSLAIEERVSGENHPAVAIRLNNLAITLQSLGQHGKAKYYLERALSIDERLYDENHPFLATRLSNLAVSFHALGKYEEAKSCTERSILIKEKALGVTHSSLTSSLIMLGTILINMGQCKQAKHCLERAQAIVESANLTEHPIYAATLNNLGKALNDLGHLTEAKSCLEKALFIYSSIYHDKHPSMAVVLSNLGITVLSLGQYQQAEEHLNEALSLQEKVHHAEHPSLTYTLDNLGRTYHSLAKYDKAKACFDRALAIQYREFDKSHPKTAVVLCNLGDLLRAMGQYKDAKAALEKAKEIQQSSFGDDNILLAATLKNLAKTVNAMGQRETADLLLEKALTIQENTYDANNPFLADTLNTKAKFLFDSGQYEESRVCLERALSIQVHVYSEEGPLLAETKNNLERALQNEKGNSHKMSTTKQQSTTKPQSQGATI